MTNPVPVTLASLVAPTSATQALQDSLEICQQLNLPTSAWFAVQMIPDLLNVNAVLAADSSVLVALVAQGGYASLAAQMVDQNGNPITSWMALRATDQYNITPGQPTFASGPVPYTNSSATAYPYTPNNPLRFANATTGATYSSVGSGSLVTGGASATIQVQADVSGSASTTGAGVTLVLITPMIGVTVQALTVSLVGSNAETNQQILLRGQNKLATLAPIQSGDLPGPVVGGAKGIFDYVARSIPQGATPSSAPPYAVSAPITRTSRSPVFGGGTATVYIANNAGSPNATDVAVVQAAVNALVVPGGILIVIAAALPITVNIAGVVYIRSTAGLSSTQVVTNISDSLANYLDQVPIGGYTTTAANIIPISEIEDTVFDANGPGATVDLALSTPSTNVVLGASGVGVLGIPNFAVVFV